MDARRRRMLRAASCALAAALVSCCLPLAAFARTDGGDAVLGCSAADLGISEERLPGIDASHAALMDEEGTLWYGRAAGERAQIASLTKIMTAAVAAEHLDAGDRIVVTPEAAAVGESSAGLAAGDEMSFGDALKAVLTASGNDAASAVAQAAGAAILGGRGQDGGAAAREAAFVEAMNAKAAELGMDGTRFANPHGLDFDAYAQGQYSCARDVAVMLRHAMGNGLVRSSIGHAHATIAVTRGGGTAAVELANTDTMLEGYPGTCAAKTGYTLAAGPCVATAVNRGDGHEYYAVVLGSSSKPQRFEDSQALYDWVLAHRDELQAAARAVGAAAECDVPAAPAEATYQLVSAPRSVHAEIRGEQAAWPVVAEVAHADWTRRTVAATVLEPDATATVPREGGRLEQEASLDAVTGNVARGDVVGHLAFRRDGAVVWEADLVAAEDVLAPSWWEAAGIAVERFLGGFAGTPATAEGKLLNLGAMEVS